jgi:hypothetical protein
MYIAKRDIIVYKIESGRESEMKKRSCKNIQMYFSNLYFIAFI